ncbi:hypothetical protein U1Q18_039901 [Sarracenia purpurea var. burkii]
MISLGGRLLQFGDRSLRGEYPEPEALERVGIVIEFCIWSRLYVWSLVGVGSNCHALRRCPDLGVIWSRLYVWSLVGVDAMVALDLSVVIVNLTLTRLFCSAGTQTCAKPVGAGSVGAEQVVWATGVALVVCH